MAARGPRVTDHMADDTPHVLRLTFAWRGSQVSLVDAERVAMIAPASVPDGGDASATGYSFALLDASGRTVYRRPLHAPIRIDAEAFSPGRGRAIERVPVAANEGQFTVLAPDLPDARTFMLSGPADPARPQEAATELLRLDVDSLRKSSGAHGNPPQPPRGRSPGG